MDTVKNWIENRQSSGKSCFSFFETLENFSLQNPDSLKRSLTRLVSKHRIYSVWKGFYVIVPVEYQPKGIIPAVYYIDQLMKFLGRDYYISLLNAAEFYGAAHQRPMEFNVMTTPPSLRSTLKKDIKVNFNSKPAILSQYTEQRKTPTSYIRISSPELTATDLVQFEKTIGGLNRASTVLYELVESCNFRKLKADFFDYVSTPVIQRLGYLLDEVIDYKKQADELYSKTIKFGCSFRTTPLKNRKPVAGCAINHKWKVIINEQIEIDEW
ncbi:MAG: type IV toxin-antitoxin system AbiEi family antitoxin [Prevotellaceae bacterium]|jgi:predicted transcriptional regulator of viral defense system|nr:type IV toxin-antitoxin system AbiEi family antitoxin [Prevotellaceae bacterium]